jgi:hypothetical protein
MRKKRFATKTEAIEAGARALRDPERRCTYIRFYECSHCHGYHLTSTPPRYGPRPPASTGPSDGRDR